MIVFHDITNRRRNEQQIKKLNFALEGQNSELAAINRELETFSYSVSHDLRAPLRSIDGFSKAVLEDYAKALDARGKDYLQCVRAAAQQMGDIIDSLLELSRVTRGNMSPEPIDLSALASDIYGELKRQHPLLSMTVQDGMKGLGDPRLIKVALGNLLNNAAKFSSKKADPTVEFGRLNDNGKEVFFVKDNGAGFEMAYSDKLFKTFSRLHSIDDFNGSGIGLATVQRIIERHGGEIWAQGETGVGATFTLLSEQAQSKLT